MPSEGEAKTCCCGIFVLTAIILIACSFHAVEPTFLGLDHNKLSGTVSGEGGDESLEASAYKAGNHFSGLGHEFISFPGSAVDMEFGSLGVRTSEGLPVSLSVAFQIRLSRTRIMEIYRLFGDFKQVEKTMTSMTRETIQTTCTRYGANTFFQRPDNIRLELKEALTKLYSAQFMGTSVLQIQVTEIKIPRRYEAKITEMKEMEYEVRKMEEDYKLYETVQKKERDLAILAVQVPIENAKRDGRKLVNDALAETRNILQRAEADAQGVLADAKSQADAVALDAEQFARSKVLAAEAQAQQVVFSATANARRMQIEAEGRARGNLAQLTGQARVEYNQRAADAQGVNISSAVLSVQQQEANVLEARGYELLYDECGRDEAKFLQLLAYNNIERMDMVNMTINIGAGQSPLDLAPVTIPT